MIGRKRNRETHREREKMKRGKKNGEKKNIRRLIHVGIEQRKTRLFAEIDRP